MKDQKSTFNSHLYPDPPSATDVREEMEHVFASQAFPANEKRRAFLRFIVEETLAGRAANLKGFTIAVSVFDRDESFDASDDPVVRIEARRLRRDLDSYYMHEGKDDSVRISIPKGSYVPHFEFAELADSNKVDGRSEQLKLFGSGVSTALVYRFLQRHWIITVLAVLITIFIASAAYVQIEKSQRADSVETVMQPSIQVRLFEALDPSTDSRYLATGISQALITNLTRFSDLKVFASPTLQTNGLNKELSEIAPSPEATYLVSGSVQEEGGQIHVVSTMVHAASYQVVWTETYIRPLKPQAIIQLQSELAEDIATKLGQTYGYIQNDAQSRRGMREVSNVQSYLCVQRALNYRRGFFESRFDEQIECLQKAVTDDPRYSDAWAMLGWLHLDAGRFEFSEPEQKHQEYQKAFEYANQAVILEPDNPLALSALSAINHYKGNYKESARLARLAVAVNPNDPDTLAQLGWRLTVRGNFEEGVPILEKAIDRSLNPPGWYFHLIAVHLYMTGQYQQMLNVAERSAVNGSDFSQMLIAIACGALSDRQGAEIAFAKIPQGDLMAREPETYMRENGASDEIVDALMTGLNQAQQLAFGGSD